MAKRRLLSLILALLTVLSLLPSVQVLIFPSPLDK